MTISAATALLTFEDYLTYDDGSENRYELVDGELVAMSPPAMEHFLIAKFLEQALDSEVKRLQHPWICFRESGIRTGLRKSRITDVAMVTLEQAQELKGRSVIFSTSPLLVIEVVSPDSVTRDYRYKRTEYAALEIPEYWIVDPLESKVTVLIFNEGLYEEAVFGDGQALVSPTFPELTLTVEQILAAGELP